MASIYTVMIKEHHSSRSVRKGNSLVPTFPSMQSIDEEVMSFQLILTLSHKCPTFWLAWAALSEEGLSWAVYKIYNTVNIYKYKNFIYLLKHAKREQQNDKTSGIFDLVFVKLMHQAALMAAAATLSEFSRHSSEILMTFYSSCASPLRIVVHKRTYYRKV